MPSINNNIPIRFFDFSQFFFNIVTASLKQTIKDGNRNSIMCKPTDDYKAIYERETTWSDMHIIVPVLFNFFHGMELWLKGAHYLQEEPSNRANHKLSELLSHFKSEYPSQITLHQIFEDYILPTDNCPILQNFYQSNGIGNSDLFYELLKYPYDKKHETSFYYNDIRNLTSDGIPFFQKIIQNIAEIQAETPTLTKHIPRNPRYRP